MANEARFRSELNILKSNLNYRSHPNDFRGTVTGTKGPVPGAISATLSGTDVDFSQLTTPGYCRIYNLDTTNFVTVGVWDGTSFYPLMEVLPGEAYVIRLSRSLTQEYGTGTGTTGLPVNRLRVKANTAAVNVVVEAFET